MVDVPRLSVNTDRSDELCFGCGQKNPIGLKLTFAWDGKVVRTEFTLGKLYQGFPGIVHGGILSCVLDDTMNQAAFLTGVDCLTVEMNIRFKRPALVEEPLVATGRVTSRNKRILETEGQITLPDGTLVAEAKASWYIVDKDSGQEKGPGGSNAGK